tara:strand:+ start:5530 stop:6300 length:771 start_codon:yes stop_codon:yes gene_type:complete
MPLRATITFVKAQSLASYVNASAQDFHLTPQTVSNPFEYDTLTLSEVALILVTKSISDGVSFTELKILELNKAVPDSFSLIENVLVATDFNKTFTDGFTLSDALINVNNDIVTPDNSTLLDVLDYAIDKTILENLPISELLASLLSKIVPDSFSFTDVIDISTGRAVDPIDSFSFTDTNLWNFNKGVPDSLSFADSQIMNHNRILIDAFALDDSALVDKDYIGNKGNVFSFNDTISITTVQGRALGNMVLGSTQFN